MKLQGWTVAGKSWTAFLGSLIVALLPGIAQVAGLLPAPWGAILTGIGGVLSLITGRVAYSAPYQPVPSPPSAPAAPTNPNSPWPQS